MSRKKFVPDRLLSPDVEFPLPKRPAARQTRRALKFGEDENQDAEPRMSEQEEFLNFLGPKSGSKGLPSLEDSDLHLKTDDVMIEFFAFVKP